MVPLQILDVFADIDDEMATGVYAGVMGNPLDATSITMPSGPIQPETPEAQATLSISSPPEALMPHRPAVQAALSPARRATAAGRATSPDPVTAATAAVARQRRAVEEPELPPGPHRAPSGRAPGAEAPRSSHASSSSMSSIDFGLGPCPLPSLIATQTEAPQPPRPAMHTAPADNAGTAEGAAAADHMDARDTGIRPGMRAPRSYTVGQHEPRDPRRRGIDQLESGLETGIRGAAGGLPMHGARARQPLYEHRPRRIDPLEQQPLGESYSDVIASAAAALGHLS